MWTCLKTQLREMVMRKGFILTILILSLYSAYAILSWFDDYKAVYQENMDVSFLYSADISYLLSPACPAFGMFCALFPFIIALPFAASYIQDNTQKVKDALIFRSSRKHYFISKGIICFIGTAAAFMLPLLLNLIMCHIVFPHNFNTPYADYGLLSFNDTITRGNLSYNTPYPQLPFWELYVGSPLLYNLLYTLIFSLFSGLLSVFLLSISYYLKRRAFLLFLPVYVIIRISSAFETAAINAAISNPDFSYINLSILDYIIPFSKPGLSPVFFAAVVLFILAFIVFSHIYAIKNEGV